MSCSDYDEEVTVVKSTPPNSQDVEFKVETTSSIFEHSDDENSDLFVPETPPSSESEIEEGEIIVVVKESRPSSPDGTTSMSSVPDSTGSKKLLTTGCSVMDEWFNGGIPTSGITELYGEKGSGRSQLCMQLAVTAQLSKSHGGLDSYVLYISSDAGSFVLQRFNEIACFFVQKYFGKIPPDPSKNVFVKYCLTSKSLRDFILNQLDDLLRHLGPTAPIRLIIIDTITGPFRLDLGEYLDRRDCGLTITKIGSWLREYSERHKAAIVICNDISKNPLTGRVVSALGGFVEKIVSHKVEMDQRIFESNRIMKVHSSSHFFKLSAMPITVSEEGVKG